MFATTLRLCYLLLFEGLTPKWTYVVLGTGVPLSIFSLSLRCAAAHRNHEMNVYLPILMVSCIVCVKEDTLNTDSTDGILASFVQLRATMSVEDVLFCIMQY